MTNEEFKRIHHLPGGDINDLKAGYTVQYTMPVDNPVNNVSKTVRNGIIHFEVPVNHPLAHCLGLSDLLLSVESAKHLKPRGKVIHKP